CDGFWVGGGGCCAVYILVANEKQRLLDYEKSIVCITKNRPRQPGRVWAALGGSGQR
ncbi:unnamed protein product, partial [Prunus brigantina]